MRGSVNRTIIHSLLALGALAAFAIIYWWVDAVGLLLGILVATAAILHFIREEVPRPREGYLHGYHAGYHAGADVECFGPDCAVLSQTRRRMAEVTELATSGVAAVDPFPAALQSVRPGRRAAS